MINHEKTVYNLGFLRGSLSKAMFLLFAAALVFPMDGTCKIDSTLCSDGDQYVNYGAGLILSVIASVQILKVCRTQKTDSNNLDPVMEV